MKTMKSSYGHHNLIGQQGFHILHPISYTALWISFTPFIIIYKESKLNNLHTFWKNARDGMGTQWFTDTSTQYLNIKEMTHSIHS